MAQYGGDVSVYDAKVVAAEHKAAWLELNSLIAATPYDANSDPLAITMEEQRLVDRCNELHDTLSAHGDGHMAYPAFEYQGGFTVD